MRIFLLLVLILSTRVCFAQSITDLLNNKIQKDQDLINTDQAAIDTDNKVINAEQADIAHKQQEILDTQSDLDSYNQDIPAVQSIDEQNQVSKGIPINSQKVSQ